MKVVYGTSVVTPYRRRSVLERWYGWIKWPLDSGGAHYSGHGFPFRWMAAAQARAMAKAAGGGTPADAEMVRRFEAGGCDTLSWRRPIYWTRSKVAS